MAGELDFEKPLVELKDKLHELRSFSEDKELHVEEEIKRLEIRYNELQEQIYSHLTPLHKLQLARHPQRPTTMDYIERIFDGFVELHGDRLYGDDLAIVGGLATFNGTPVTVIGHQRGKDTKDNIARNFGMTHPEGFRKALRLMKQANKFNRPVITLIDTKGAFPGSTAEERGQSEAIARNLFEMSGFSVPIICIVIGEGGSGGALALCVGNRILMLENAIYSVISPEGAASILWRDGSQYERAAEAMKITAADIYSFGIADEVVAEPFGGAHRDVDEQAVNLKLVLERHLAELLDMDEQQLREDRYQKFRQIGCFEETN